MQISDKTSIGLVNRFHVTVTPGKGDLGSWAKVEGLEVSFDMPEYRSGDNPNFLYFCPANTKYAHVKLVRATSAEDSPKVQGWLSDNAKQFQHGELMIELKDAKHAKVMTWTLRDAIPLKWSITNFDSAGGAVATETLEIIHGGFLEDMQH
jgi:phage tail-like protein